MAENEEAKAINRAVFNEYLRTHPADLSSVDQDDAWRRRGAIRVLATVQGVDAGVVQYVRSMPLKRLNQRPGELDLLLGGELLILQNQHVHSGIVNGTLAVLHDIVLRPGAAVSFAQGRENTGYGVHTVEAVDVVALVLQHTVRGLQSRAVFSTLPAGFFPLVPSVGGCLGPGKDERMREQTFAYGGRVGLKPKVTQFACVPAYSLTCHKYQGQTASSVLIAGYGQGADSHSAGRAEAHRCGTKGWLYVALSRVRTLNSLYLLTPIQSDADKFIRRFDVIEEMDRLRAEVFVPTLRRLRVALSLENDPALGPAPAPARASAEDAADELGSASLAVLDSVSLSAREKRALAVWQKRYQSRRRSDVRSTATRAAGASGAPSNASAASAARNPFSPLRSGSSSGSQARRGRQFVRARRRIFPRR